MHLITLADRKPSAGATLPTVAPVAEGPLKRVSRTTEVLLWTAQGLLALLFLFAGGVKLAMPVDVLAGQTGLPGPFIQCIAVAEVLGALGLVLPGLLRVGRGLTPLAAAGLVAIMSGATVLSLVTIGAAAGIFPLVVGLVLAAIARGRRSWAPRLFQHS